MHLAMTLLNIFEMYVIILKKKTEWLALLLLFLNRFRYNSGSFDLMDRSLLSRSIGVPPTPLRLVRPGINMVGQVGRRGKKL